MQRRSGAPEARRVAKRRIDQCEHQSLSPQGVGPRTWPPSDASSNPSLPAKRDDATAKGKKIAFFLKWRAWRRRFGGVSQLAVSLFPSLHSPAGTDTEHGTNFGSPARRRSPAFGAVLSIFKKNHDSRFQTGRVAVIFEVADRGPGVFLHMHQMCF